MNAVKITQTLKKALVDYLMTTFDANKDGKEPELARKLRESYEAPRALFIGPYLELIYPYEKDASLRHLCSEGILSLKLLGLPSFSLANPEPISLDAPLYSHQTKAIRKLCTQRRSIVISSGTGSGKTEGFSIPIVNDLLEDDSPGVRALLVYPLNALVNDQMERLRVMLKGTSITFGRFTSELPSKAERDERWLPNEIISRDEIRVDGRIPQILITNYAMLEYLLFRPEDTNLFSKPESWKYIVLDEAHTYNGAQGIEVAMLIRRLKQRLGKKKGEMLCVATSATLVNDNPSEATDFAHNLFDEDFTDDDIIFGEEEQYPSTLIKPMSIISPEAYLNNNFEEMLEEMRKAKNNGDPPQEQDVDVETIAYWLSEIGLIDDDGLALSEKFLGDLPGYLFKVLSGNLQLTALRDWMVEQQQPVLFEDAAAHVFPSFDQHDRTKALYHLIEIGAIARPAPNQLPLLPAKYHIFARPPQGTWVCINPACPGKETDNRTKWSRVFSNPTNVCESCGAQVYPIFLCRECGQVYIATHYTVNKSTYSPAVEQVTEGTEKRYFSWSFIEENSLLANFEDGEEDAEEQEETSSGNAKLHQDEIIICLNCGRQANHCSCQHTIGSIPLYDIQEKKTTTRRGQPSSQFVPVKELNECPRCHSKSKSETEIATPITINGTGPLANLTYELYRELPTATDVKKKSLPGEGRKLLSFYDSRQGAARFAAFLQDVSVKQNYLRVIPMAIEQCLQPDEWGEHGSPGLIRLSQKCAEIAWRYGIIQNDSDSEIWRRQIGFNSDQRRATAVAMTRKLLGEFTTGRRGRQSLESMGLVGVNYFQESNLQKFEDLASQIKLSPEQTQSLVGHLLDDLRFRKIVKLPGEIHADDTEFGPNKWNPRLIRQGKPGSDEQSWIGATNRQSRRQYIKFVLDKNNVDSSDDAVIKTLTDIWDWMVNKDEALFLGSAAQGYQLNPDHMFFDTNQNWHRCKKCQRISYRGASIPCPFPGCFGELETIDIAAVQSENYYYNSLNQPLVPIRVEEHTAQLDSDLGREYQNLFKDGRINALSCSTTFEMGIDLGDLQAVVMSNVPPTVANYRQRAGRAGRRTSGTAYILTWTSDRPHDQAYYDDPIEIISGQIRVPKIMLENEFIIRRHVNALLISQFLRYRKSQGVDSKQLTFCGDFFDKDRIDPPQYSYLDEWIEAEREEIQKQLHEYSRMIPENMRALAENGVRNLKNDLNKLNDEHYQLITRYYRDQIQQLAGKLGDTSINSNERKELEIRQRYFWNLLDRMRGSNDKRTGYLIEYLSNKGVMPSYSFPLHTVELLLPRESRDGERLRLERDLRQAIREYAPGSEIVADKKIWRSQRPIFWRDTPRIQEYRICEHCHHLMISDEAGVPLQESQVLCPVCDGILGSKSRTRKFVEPDGFIADPKSGKPAKQYVNVEPSQMRSALIPEHNLEEEEHSKYVNLAYNQKGNLLYVNEGKYGNGFSFPTQAFSLFSDNGKNEKLSLGFKQETNTLHIRFISDTGLPVPSPTDQSTWLSLLYAIIHGASHSLQIERRDIDGVLFPINFGGRWEQTIVLYDNVPGGAGHVKNIKENLSIVLNEARRILNCNDCAPDTSCYHCLRDYNNQYHHQLLKRDSALKFLDLLISSQEPLEIGVPGALMVVAPSTTVWLFEKIRYTKESLFIAVQSLGLGHPIGDNYTWLDTLGELSNKDRKVSLHIQELPANSGEGLIIRSHLQVLMDKGLKVWKIETLPKWQILIDRNSSEKRAICSSNDQTPIILEDQIGTKNLVTSSHQEAIELIGIEWDSLQKTRVSRVDLDPPGDVRVISIKSNQSGITEKILFSDFFSKPCIKMTVHDPYLMNRDVIVDRLGEYISMASQHNTLDEVIIQTRKANDSGEQEAAERELIRKHPVNIRFEHKAEHDRFIEVIRLNGEKAKIILGRGLDFLQPDGSTKATYIIIQDPL